MPHLASARHRLALCLVTLTTVAVATLTTAGTAQAANEGTLCQAASNAPVYNYDTGARMYTITPGYVMRILGRVIDGKYAGYYYGHGNSKPDGVAWPGHFRLPRLVVPSAATLSSLRLDLRSGRHGCR